MNDQQKTTSDVQARADALLAEIRAENGKFNTATSPRIAEMESGLTSLEGDLDKMEKEMETFGKEISDELEATALARGQEIDASAADDENL